MKYSLLLLVMNIPSIICAFFAGYIILTKGYIDGTGWLIFGAVCLHTSFSKKDNEDDKNDL